MLFPESTKQPFAIELFKNPSSAYRGAPFWSWNCKLDEDELLRQIDILKKMGFGGFHIHVRTGMATTYLSDEFMGLVKACVEKARAEGMKAYLYDEDRYPSGAAGGLATKDPKNRLQHLLLTRTPYVKKDVTSCPPGSIFGALRLENGDLLACYDIVLNKNGELQSYRVIDESESASGFKLYAYLEPAVTNP